LARSPSAKEAWRADQRVPKGFQAISLLVQCSAEASDRAWAAHVMGAPSRPPSLAPARAATRFSACRVSVTEQQNRATARPVPLSFAALVDCQQSQERYGLDGRDYSGPPAPHCAAESSYRACLRAGRFYPTGGRLGRIVDVKETIVRFQAFVWVPQAPEGDLVGT
jgi:hypothetical protein